MLKHIKQKHGRLKIYYEGHGNMQAIKGRLLLKLARDLGIKVDKNETVKAHDDTYDNTKTEEDDSQPPKFN